MIHSCRWEAEADLLELVVVTDGDTLSRPLLASRVSSIPSLLRGASRKEIQEAVITTVASSLFLLLMRVSRLRKGYCTPLLFVVGTTMLACCSSNSLEEHPSLPVPVLYFLYFFVVGELYSGSSY